MMIMMIYRLLIVIALLKGYQCYYNNKYNTRYKNKLTSLNSNSITNTNSKSLPLLTKAFVNVLLLLSPSSSYAIDMKPYSDDIVSFVYSSDLILTEKPVKTHEKEVYLKSEKYKGFNVGYTQDPVKINNIKDFTSPQGLSEKVTNVEKNKEGVFEVDVISYRENTTPVSSNGNFPSYDLEYKIDSSRGKNHYVIRTVVVDKKLYVFTAQCKEDNYDELKDGIDKIINTFIVKEKNV